MKVIRLIILSVLLLLFSFCDNIQAHKTIVVGYLNGKKGKVIIYPYQTVSSAVEAKKLTIEGTIINGKFRVELDGRRVLRDVIIKLDGKTTSHRIFFDSGKVTIKQSKEGKLIVKGSKINDEYLRVSKVLDLPRYYKLQYSHNIQGADKDFMDSFSDKVLKQVSLHPKSIPLSQVASIVLFGKTYSVLEKFTNKFDKYIKKTYYVSNLIDTENIAKSVAVGKKAPLFTLPNSNGGLTNLKDFEGHYLLIDFWASWCGPCRKEIPNIKNVYSKFHSQGLEILSVSTDYKELDWRKALSQENMKWIQCIDNKQNIGNLYNISFIPHIILISPKGVILAKDIRGEGIWKELEKYGFKK